MKKKKKETATKTVVASFRATKNAMIGGEKKEGLALAGTAGSLRSAKLLCFFQIKRSFRRRDCW